MSRKWRWVLPAYLWCLPMAMAGFIISLLFYRAHSWKWMDGILTCVGGKNEDGTTRIWGQPNAQTLGWVVIYDTEESRLETNLRVHEAVHVVQGFIGGIVGVTLTPVLFAAVGWPAWLGLALGGFIGGLGFAALYAILFVYLFLKQGTGWYWAYRANPFEIQAYTIQDKFIENPDKETWGA